MSIIYSIVIPTYNRCELLLATLNSLLLDGSLLANNIELLVIDNNSTDKTKEMMVKYTSSDSRIRYIFEPSQGLSYAKNCAINHSRGEFIAFLDDDIHVPNGWFFNITKHLGDPEVGVVGSKVLPYNIEMPVWLHTKYYHLVSLFDLGNKPLYVRDVMGGNCVIRKSLLLDAGGFNINLGRKGDLLLSGEENDVYRKIISMGYKVYYEPDAPIYHKIASKVNIEYILRYSRSLGYSAFTVDSHGHAAHRLIKITIKSIAMPLHFVNSLLPINAKYKVSSKIQLQHSLGYISAALKPVKNLVGVDFDEI